MSNAPASSASGIPIKQLAISCLAAFVLLNVVFNILAGSYFESHRIDYPPEVMSRVRIEFGVLTGVVAAAAFAAGYAPRLIGHLIAVMFGVANLIGGIAAIAQGLPGALVATLVIAGILMPVLAWHSYRGSRPAWAFLVAICGVLAVVELFAGPRLRTLFGMGLWLTMLLPGLKAVATFALASLRDGYAERPSGAAPRTTAAAR